MELTPRICCHIIACQDNIQKAVHYIPYWGTYTTFFEVLTLYILVTLQKHYKKLNPILFIHSIELNIGPFAGRAHGKFSNSMFSTSRRFPQCWELWGGTLHGSYFLWYYVSIKLLSFSFLYYLANKQPYGPPHRK